MTTRKIRGILLVLFAGATIGAKDCGLWTSTSTSSNSPPTPQIPPNYCRTDPPLGCMGVCITTEVPGMGMPPPSVTGDCDAGGSLAKLFIDDVETTLVCDPNMYPDMASYVVFPPFFSITPEVVQTGSCVLPPALPDTMPLSAFMGFDQ